jgi:gliding motility-associated lipoprotein GldH
VRAFISCLSLVVVLCACDTQKIYDTYIDLGERKWSDKVYLKYSFDITDTTQAYDFLYQVRYTLAYPYCNFYVRYKLIDMDKKLISKDVHELRLMDCTTGEPLGTGVGELIDLPLFFIKNKKFSKPGKYLIEVSQYMREPFVKEIAAFGVKVQKAEKTQ